MIGETPHMQNMQDNYVGLLNQMGFSKNEAKVYLALLEKNTSQAAELVSISGVPQKMIYYTLQKLMRRGLCTLIPGKIKRYKPTDPNIGIEQLIVQYEQQFEAAREMLENLKIQYNDGKNETSPLVYEVISNLDQLGRRSLELFDNSETEVLSFIKPPYATPRKEILSKENKKGRKVYGIREGGDSMTQEEKDNLLLVISNISCDEELRIVKKVPVKMAIFDRKITLFTLDDLVTFEPTLTAMVITHQGFALLMRHIFMNIWEQAIPYHEFIKDWCLNK